MFIKKSKLEFNSIKIKLTKIKNYKNLKTAVKSPCF
ncbi:Hypothetical protein AJF4211_000140 [Avibacterium paragallinarum JF4211]|nr:Hypothetical protein AJF4211_000140 [Avibacterium paragallinarum JF4211]